MYNYSLLNNAIRLLLISHSTTTQQQDKHTHIRCHSFAVCYVGLSCQFVISERWLHAKDAHALLSREGRVK